MHSWCAWGLLDPTRSRENSRSLQYSSTIELFAVVYNNSFSTLNLFVFYRFTQLPSSIVWQLNLHAVIVFKRLLQRVRFVQWNRSKSLVYCLRLRKGACEKYRHFWSSQMKPLSKTLTHDATSFQSCFGTGYIFMCSCTWYKDQATNWHNGMVWLLN